MSLLNVLLESLIREFDGSQEQSISIKQMIANHPGAFMLKCTEILSDMSELTAQYIQILRLMLQASQSITRTMLDSEIAVIQCTMILKRTINKVISQPNEDVNTIITDLHVRLMGISEDLVINHISDFFESGRVPEVVILRIIKEIFRTGTKEYFRQFSYEILQKILSSLSLVKLDAQRLDYCDLLETIYKALLYFQENDVPVNSEQVQQVTWLIFDQVKDWLSTNTNIAVLSLIGFMCQFISKDRLERSVEKLNGTYLQVLKSKTPLRQLFEGFNKFLERLYALDRQFYENIIKSITVSIYEFFKSPVFSPNYPFDEKNLKSKNDLLSLLQTLSRFNIDNCLDLFIARINSKEHIERISCLWLCHFLISRNFKQISEPYKKQLVMQLLNLQFEQDAELRFAICEIIFQFCQQLREDPIQYIDMKALMFYLLQQVSIHDREIEEYGRVKSAPFETTLEILKQRAQKILWTVSNEFPNLMWPMSIEIINNQKFSPGLSNIFKCLSNIVPKLEIFKFQTPHIVLVRILLLIQIPYFFQNLGLEGIIFLPHLLRNLDIKLSASGYQIIENLRLHLSQKLEVNFAYEDRVIQLWKVILLSLIQNVQLSVIEEDFQAQMSTYITSTALKLPIMRMQATLTSFLMNQETIKYSLDRLFSICHPEYVNQTINLNIQITEPDLNLRVCVAECFGYIGERHPQLTLEKVKTIMNSEVIQKKSSGGLKDMISMFQRSNDSESVQSVRGTLILALGSISRHVPLEMIERQILPNVLPFLETQSVYLNIALEKIAKSIDLSLEQNEEQVVQQFLNQFTRSRDAILDRAYKNIKEPRCINIINLMMRLQSVIDYTKLCAHLKLHLEVHPTEAFENLFPLFLGIVRVEEDGQMLSMWQTLLMLLNSIKDHEELLEILQKTMQRHKLRLESQHRYAFRVLLVLLSIMYQGNSRASVFIIEKVLLSMNIFIDIHQRTDDAFNQQIVIELIPKLQPPEMNILLQEIQNILNENVNHSGFSSLLLAAYEKIELTKYLQLVQSLRISECPTLKEILSRLAKDNLHKTLQVLLEQQSQFPLSEFNLIFIAEIVNNRGTLIKSIAFLTDVLNNPEDIITSSIGNYMVNASLFLGQILDNECVSELIPKAFPQLLSTFLLRFMTSQDHPNAPESAVWAFQNLLKLRSIEGISQSVLKKLTLESEVSDGIEEIMMIYKCDVQEKRKIFDFMRGFTEKKSIAYRLAAVIVIGQFVRDNKNFTPDFYTELLEVLLSMDHDNSEKVRSQVALGLGSVSYCEQDLELMPEILASLMESLDDPQECCVRSAMISIQHLITFVPPELVQTLIIKVSGSFESQSPRIRISAFNLFAKLCVSGNQIPPHALISVILHLLDESVSVRQVCKLALEKLGDVMEQPKFKEISNGEFQYENATHLEDNEKMILGVVLTIDLDPETVIEFCNSPDQNIRGAAIYTIILMKALKNVEDQRISEICSQKMKWVTRSLALKAAIYLKL